MSKPREGDLVFFEWGDNETEEWPGYDHVGIVSRPARHVTIEGNTSCGTGEHAKYTHVERRVRKGAYWGGEAEPGFVRVTR